MNREEYEASVEELIEKRDRTLREYASQLTKLAIQYAHDNSPYGVGDLVSNGDTTIIIDGVRVFGSNPPSCIYDGVRATKKKGIPFKSGKRGCVYQMYAKEVKR